MFITAKKVKEFAKCKCLLTQSDIEDIIDINKYIMTACSQGATKVYWSNISDEVSMYLKDAGYSISKSSDVMQVTIYWE